jgi:hypothetical protein
VIPVEVTQTRWHFMTWPDAFDHWQTIIGGVFALVAAFGIEIAKALAPDWNSLVPNSERRPAALSGQFE